MNTRTYPHPARAWAMVGLLMIAYVLSYMDRSVFGNLLEPIKAEFELSDTQMGLLGGLAFGIFYGLLGVPLGWLGDRYSRRNIVAAGVAVWSLATALTGLARGFFSLFGTRLMTGAGEATLSPCAMSMISDMFPKHRRGLAVAIYSMAISIGLGVGSIFLGWLIKTAEYMDLSPLRGFGIDTAWRLVFVVLGLPGLIVAALFLLMREPRRQHDSGENPGSIVQTAAYLLRHRQAFFGIFGLGVIMSICTYYSYTWNPVFYVRTYGWNVPEYLRLTGYFVLILGPLSMIASGFLIDILTRKGYDDAPIKVMKLGLLIIVSVFVIYPLMPNYWTAFLVFQISTFGFTMATAAGPTALLAISPARMKAQIMAWYYMIISLIGLTLGPLIVGVLNDHVFHDANMIAKSLFVVALVLVLPTLYLLIRPTEAYRQQVLAQ